MKSFRELVVWEKSLTLCERVYEITKKLPRAEQFALASQVQRAAVSISSNIAEGAQRNNRGEFKQFCGIAYGSAAELETQLELLRRIYGLADREVTDLLNEVLRMLRKLIQRLGSNH